MCRDHFNFTTPDRTLIGSQVAKATHAPTGCIHIVAHQLHTRLGTPLSSRTVLSRYDEWFSVRFEVRGLMKSVYGWTWMICCSELRQMGQNSIFDRYEESETFIFEDFCIHHDFVFISICTSLLLSSFFCQLVAPIPCFLLSIFGQSFPFLSLLPQCNTLVFSVPYLA